MSRVRLILWTVLALAVVAFAALTAIRNVDEAPVKFAVNKTPFTLTNHLGQQVDESLFTGKVTALFFGYTHCPDVCPATLGEAVKWRAELGDAASNLQVVFVSVDPERDSVELLAEYIPYFHESFIGLTGEPDQVELLTKSLGVYAEKSQIESDDVYLVDHTASVYLVDNRGFFASTIGYGEATETAVAKLQRLLDRAG